MKKALTAILFVVVLLAGIYVVSTQPRTDREWTAELKETAFAELRDGKAYLKNVRDWTYAEGKILSEDWIDEVEVNPEEVVRAWFVLEPFDEWEAVGHTYLTFEFADGRAYSFSVEARREAHEGYSAFVGLFREYELSYTWGTERDFLARRLLYLDHPVRMYPLALDAKSAQTYFLELVRKTNDVSLHPRFYQTLTANCTNVLAEIANESARGAVPYDISWNLPGLSDGFLMRIGYIKPVGTKEETKQVYDLTPYKKDIEAIATESSEEFTRKLRLLPPFQNSVQSGITP